MTLQQIDDVLKVWKTRLSAIAENLLELQSDTTFQSLTGTGGLQEVAVSGATALRIKPALRTMNVLFEQFGALQRIVEQAEKLREDLPTFFSAEPKLREIQSLLFTRSIEIEAVSVPIAERALLAGPQVRERVAPEELLDGMTRTFTSVRDAVAEVGQAWARLAESIDRVETEISRLRTQTALPSALLTSTLDGVDAKLAAAKAQARVDPIGALAAVTAVVEPALAHASQRVTAAENVSGQLRSARFRWDTVQRDHAAALASVHQTKEKVSDGKGSTQPVDEAKFHGVGEWLARLERKRDEGAIEAVGVGLRNWFAAADACLADDRKAFAASEARLAARGELRGRFDALRAKAKAHRLDTTPETADCAAHAEQALYARPMDLENAAAALARYERSLRTAPVVPGSERRERTAGQP